MVDDGSSVELPLEGGNSNVVVRVGSTVRRTVPRNGGSVHRLLEYLESVGFAETPRFLGIDSQGREILSYIDGQAGLHPFSVEVRSEHSLAASVDLVRRYHDATAPFARTTTLPWRGVPVPGLAREVICHRDLAPYNFIFQGEAPVGIIDFDNAAAGSRVEDLAYFAYRFVPFSADQNLEAAGWSDDVDRAARLHFVVEHYGRIDYRRLLDIALTRLDEMQAWIRRKAALGDPAVETHLRDDHIGIYAADAEWIRENRPMLNDILEL